MSVHAKSLQLCPAFCNVMDSSPPGSSVQEFSMQEHWSRLPCHPSGDLPNPGIEPVFLMSPALAGGFFTTTATWEAQGQGEPQEFPFLKSSQVILMLLIQGPRFEKHCLEKLLPMYTMSYAKDCSLHQYYNSEKLETDLKFISRIDIQLTVYLYK